MQRHEGGTRAATLRDLEILIIIADAGSIRRAAESLGVEPSSISRRLRSLEDRLGVSLFERRSDGMHITSAGRRMSVDAKSIISHLDLSTRDLLDAGAGRTGAVRIGIVGALASRQLTNLISGFALDHPGVHIDFIEDTSYDLCRQVQSREIDVAFVLRTPSRTDVSVAEAWEEALYVAFPAEDLRSGAPSVSISDLQHDTFVVTEYGSGAEAEDFLRREVVGDMSSIRFTHHRVGRETLMMMVGLKFGLALACEAEAAVAYPGVVFSRLEGKAVLIRMIWLNASDNPALRRFLSTASTWLQSQRIKPMMTA